MYYETQETLLRESRVKGIKYFENYYNKEDKKQWFKHINEDTSSHSLTD